jgi:NhaA family Na+:H+ antiporter
MTIFFLLIGLELERNLRWRTFKYKDALLPIFAALGGMIVPGLCT